MFLEHYTFKLKVTLEAPENKVTLTLTCGNS